MTEAFINSTYNKLLEINNNSTVFLDFNTYLKFKSWFIKTLKKYNKNYSKRDLLRDWNIFQEKYIVLLKIKNYEHEHECE
jgi:hypothetical protein